MSRVMDQRETHHPVLWIDGSEGTWLADVRRVAQHGRIARLAQRPRRRPGIRGRVQTLY